MKPKKEIKKKLSKKAIKKNPTSSIERIGKEFKKGSISNLFEFLKFLKQILQEGISFFIVKEYQILQITEEATLKIEEQEEIYGFLISCFKDFHLEKKIELYKNFLKEHIPEIFQDKECIVYKLEFLGSDVFILLFLPKDLKIAKKELSIFETIFLSLKDFIYEVLLKDIVVKEYEKKINHLKLEHQKDLKVKLEKQQNELNRQKENEIKGLELDFQRKLEETFERHKKELKNLEKKWIEEKEWELKVQREEWERRLIELEKQYKGEVKRWEERIHELEIGINRYKDQIEKINREKVGLEQEIEFIKIENTKRIEEKERKIAELNLKWENQLKEINDRIVEERNKIEESWKKKLASELEKIVKDYESKIQHLIEEKDIEKQNLEGLFLEKIQDLNKEKEKLLIDLDEQKKIFEKTLHSKEEEIQKLHNEYKEKLKELETRVNQEWESKLAYEKEQLKRSYEDTILSLKHVQENEFYKLKETIHQYKTELEELQHEYEKNKESLKNHILSLEQKQEELQFLLNQKELENQKQKQEYTEQINNLHLQLTEKNKMIERIEKVSEEKIKHLLEELRVKAEAWESQRKEYEDMIGRQISEIEELKRAEEGLWGELSRSKELISKYESEIESKKRELLETEERYQKKIIKLEEENLLVVEELNGSIKDLKSNIDILRLQNEEKDQKISSLLEELNFSHRQNQDLLHRIKALEQDLQKTYNSIKQLEEEYSEKIKIFHENHEREIHKYQQQVEILKSELKTKESENQVLKKEIADLKQQIQKQYQEIQHFTKKIENLQREGELKNLEIKESKEIIKEKNELIRSHHIQIQNQQKEIKNKDYIIIKLEEELKLITNDYNKIKSLYKDLQNQKENLTEEIQKLKKYSEDLENVLNQKEESIHKLNMELQNSYLREKRSKKTSQTIIDFIFSISELPDLKSRLDFINQTFFESQLKRYCLLELKDEAFYLYFSSCELPPYRIFLKESIFGEIITERKLMITSKEKDISPYELTLHRGHIHFYKEEEYQHIEAIYKNSLLDYETYIILPIVVNTIVVGILVLVTQKKFDRRDEKLYILENLIPILSVSFENDKIFKEHEKNYHILNVLKETEQILLEKQRKINYYYIQEKPLDTTTKSLFDKQDVINQLLEIGLNISNYNYASFDKTVLEFFNKIAEIFSKSDYIFKLQFNEQDLWIILDLFKEYKTYFLWFYLECLLNAVFYSEAKIFGLEIINSEKYIDLYCYDDGEGILRKAGSLEPKQGQGIQLLKNISFLTNAKFQITKGLNGFGTGILLRWNKFTL